MAKKSFLINNLYLGPLELWKHLFKKDEIILECHENYQKKSYRNKCDILCSSGVEVLSIPLKKGKHGGVNIKEVEISYDTDWQRLHVKKIKDAYIKAPYYDYYIPSLEGLIMGSDTFLFDFNYKLFLWTLDSLNLTKTITQSQDFYLSVPSSIIDGRPLSKLNQNPIATTYPIYPQVYEYKFGFKPNLSIVDLLMNQGPEAIVYLKQLQEK